MNSAWASPVVISAIAVGAVAVIGAFFAGLVTAINAWRVVANKISAIEGHVNSEKTASEGREIALRQENVLLRQMYSDAKAAAALLAQAAATRSRETDLLNTIPKDIFPLIK